VVAALVGRNAFDIDEICGPTIEREPGAGDGDHPPAERCSLRHSGPGPDLDTHLAQPEGGRGRQSDAGHAELGAEESFS